MTDYKSMFEQAVRTLAAIDEALGIGDDGCGDPDQTLTAIAELKDAAQAVQRSKYPTRYAARVPQARSIVDALNGSATPCKPSAPQPVGACPATSSL